MSLTSARVNAIIKKNVIVFVIILVLNNRIPKKRRFRATEAISEFRSLFTNSFRAYLEISEQLISVRCQSFLQVKPQYFASILSKDHT